MIRFLGRATSRIDAKGRVIIPASFRAPLKGSRSETIHCVPWEDENRNERAIEVFSDERMDEIVAMIDDLNPYDDKAVSLQRTILTNCWPTQVDQDGRIKPPPELLEGAGITSDVLFVGCGPKFEIWEPAAFAAAEAVTRPIARQHMGELLRPAAARALRGNGGTP